MNMELLLSSEAIKKKIEKLNPKKIAVAYIGSGWQNYVNKEVLEEVIVSPTLGSNPNAINELFENYGYENIHLFTNLHSKIYLSDDAFIIGSCNLSNNALFSDDSGLFETAIYDDDKDKLSELNQLFDDYKNYAINEFSSKEEKIDKIESLIDLWKKMPKQADLNNISSKKVPNLKDYIIGSDNIKFVWYDGYLAEEDIDNASISNQIEEYKDRSFNADDISLQESDDINIGDWILQFYVKKNGQLGDRPKLEWLYVTHIAKNCVKNHEPYTKLAIQKEGGLPLVPFKLEKTKDAFCNIMNLKQFRSVLLDDENGNRVIPSDIITNSIIKKWQKLL